MYSGKILRYTKGRERRRQGYGELRKGQSMTMCIMVGLVAGMVIGAVCECIARRIGERKFLSNCEKINTGRKG